MLLEWCCFNLYKGIKEKMSGARDTVNCLNCDTVIAHYINSAMVPSPEQCYELGNVPVPNCGWFCSQECANQFSISHDLKFERNKNNLIDYYGKLI